LKIGLERGEQCLYIVDENSADTVLAAMRAQGVAVEKALQTGALAVAGKQDTYLRGGHFNPDNMIRYLTEATRAARKAGFAGFRWTGEMSWKLSGAPGSERLMEYEARLNDFLRDHDACALCQYDQHRFAPEVILDVIRTHPLVIFRETVSRNPYYVPPEDFLQPGHAGREVERLLGNILERERDTARLAYQAQLLANVNDAVLGFDERLLLTSWNRAAEEMYGWKEEEVLGQPADHVLRSEYIGMTPEEAAQALRQSGQLEVEVIQYGKEGRRIWVEAKAMALRDESGRITGNVSVNRDITERKQAEARAQRHLERISALRIIDATITSSRDQRITLHVLLEQVMTQLAVDAADILLLKAPTLTLEFAAGRGFRTTALQHTRLRVGEGYAGRAALERCTVRVGDIMKGGGAISRAAHLENESFIAYFGTPLIAKGEVKGVLEVFHRGPLDPDDEWLAFLETLAGQAAIAIDSLELFEGLQRSNLNLALAYDVTLEGWSKALDLRDKETEGHSGRVTELTLRVARAMGMGDEELAHVRRGALLHDVGKLGIPDSILLKPGALTEEEWAVMRKHPTYTWEWLSPIDYLRPALDIPYCHHEKWDGSGYPRGLKGKAIPLAARIFAIVDVWDALRSDRPYRPAWPEEKVLDHLRSQAGIHFDPQVVEVFLRVIRDAGETGS
jgi:PAS domain S-box-containing protein